MFASWSWFSNRMSIERAFLLPGLLLAAASAVAAPMRYELDLTPTATHAADSWDHNVPLNGPFNCDGACHTGAAGDFAPSGTIHTPTQSGSFLFNAMKVRYYGDSSNVKEYPDSVTGDTATAQGHYLSGGRATVTVPFARKRYLHARSVAAGQNVCAILFSGAVTCWGRDRFGGLGDGWDEDSSLPVTMTPFPASVRQVAAYYRHSCAVTADGAVWCWGSNYYGELGNSFNIGPGGSGYPFCSGPGPYWGALEGGCFEPTPAQVTGLGTVASVTVGVFFTCAQMTDGTVWCWGYNVAGGLGNGTTTDSSVPVQVTGLSQVTAVSAGDASACALRSDRTVWCWGYNFAGELGNGTTTDSSVPVQVTGLSQVTEVSVGEDSACALRSDGTVWCWGFNFYGELGNGTTTSSSVPVQVTGLSQVTAVSAGEDSVCALRSDGKVWCWGANFDGELGNGTTTNSPVPVQVTGLSQVTAVSAGAGAITCALRWDRTMWCWGYNGHGGLGAPLVEYSDIPVRVLSGSEALERYTGSFDPAAGLFVATDNTHHAIGIGSGWPAPGSVSSSASHPAPPFSPTYPGGILSDQFPCLPGNPDDYYDGSCSTSAIDGYDLRSPLSSATGHKISNQDFPNDFPQKNGPLWLVGGGSIEIDPISPTDDEHASVGYTGSFSATTLTPMNSLSVSGGATGAMAGAAFAFEGTFTLGTSGKAFAANTDDIVFGYGPYTAYLPAGTLESEESGASYYGEINGSPLHVSIRHLHDGTYGYSIAAQSVDLTGLVTPANLDLYIGDNAGSAPALARH